MGLRKEGARPRSATETPLLTEAPGPDTIAPTPVCHALATLSPLAAHAVRGRRRRGGTPVPRPPLPGERETGTHTPRLPLTVSTPPPRRATHGTHHRGGDPRSTLGKGNDTTARPRAPEGRPGALQGHHRGPSKARSRAGRGAQRSGGTAPPTNAGGGPLARHTPRRRSKSVCCVRGPRARPRREAGGGGRPRVRAGDHQPPPSTHTSRQVGSARDKERRGGTPRTQREERSRSTRTSVPRLARLRPGPGERDITTSISQSIRRATGHRAPKVGEGHGEDHHQRSLLQPHRHTTAPPPSSRATPVADDPARRTPDTWHRACGVGSSQPSPGALRRGEVESHGVEDPRATPRAPPPSGEPETGGGTAGRVSRAHTQAHTRAGAQAQAGGSRGKGTVRAPDGGPRPTAQIPACAQSPKVLSD